jgi:hypothetical protein
MEREDRPELIAEILGEGLSQAIGSSDHVQKGMLRQHCPRDMGCIRWVHWERTRWRMKKRKKMVKEKSQKKAGTLMRGKRRRPN